MKPLRSDRQRANSKEDEPTGLLNEGFHYRDPENGVWLTCDPAAFVEGPSMDAYVKQNSWTMWDPEGLSAYGNLEQSEATDVAAGDVVKGDSKAWLQRHGKRFHLGMLHA